MKNKLFIFLAFLLIINFTFVSAETTSKNLFEKVLSSFTGNVVLEDNGIERNGNFLTGYKYKDYSEEENKVIIEDGKGKIFAKVKLVSPKENKVSAGEEVMVAQFLFEDFDSTSSSRVMNDLFFYDKNKNMSEMNKNYKLKYLVLNGTNSFWIEFSRFNELPSKNIYIGLFTGTNFGESIEWVPEMFNFRISEWASYTVTDYTTQRTAFSIYSTTRDFDTENISNEYTLTAYSDSAWDGYAMINRVYSNGTIQNGTAYQFDSVYGYNPKLEPLGNDYFLNVYACYNTIYDGPYLCGIVLKAYTNNMTVASVGTRVFLGIADSSYSGLSYYSLKRLDTNLFFYAYINASDYKGYSYVVNAYTNGTISYSANYIWESLYSNLPIAVEKVDTTHALISYCNTSDYSNYDDTALVVSAYSNGTMSRISSLKYSTGITNVKSIQPYNSTTFVQVYSGNNGGNYYLYRNIFTVNPSTYAISTTSVATLDANPYMSTPSLQQVDNDSFFVTYFNYNTLTNFSYILFDVSSSLGVTILNQGNLINKYPLTTNVLTKLNNSYFTNSWSNSTNSIYALLIFVNDTTDMVENFTSGNYGAATYNALIKINDTRFLLAYHGGAAASSAWPYARTVDINSSYGATFGAATFYSFNSASKYTRLAQINATHYIVTYGDSSNTLYASILQVLSNGTVVAVTKDNTLRGATTFNGDIGTIDSNHFLVVYKTGSTNYARVVTAYANGTVIASAAEVSFDASATGYPALKGIDSNHFVVSYGGLDEDTYSQILTAYSNGTVVAGTAFEVKDAVTNYYNDIEQIDSTHYIIIHNGYANIIGVYTNNWTVYNLGSSVVFFNGTLQTGSFSLEKMNTNQYIAMYGGYLVAQPYAAYTSILAVNSSSWAISPGSPNLFHTSGGSYTEIKKIDTLHYIGAYSDTNNPYYGYIKIFSFIGGVLDSCECPGIGKNWVIDLTKYCIITTNCDLGIGLLSFSGAGNATFNTTVKTANMTAPGSGGTLYLGSNAILNITSDGV